MTTVLLPRLRRPWAPPHVPLGRALLYGARFAGLSLLVNLAALILIFVPGVNIAAFFAANAYLLSREYFELAAGRFRPMPEAAAMRVRHRIDYAGDGFLQSFRPSRSLTSINAGRERMRWM